MATRSLASTCRDERNHSRCTSAGRILAYDELISNVEGLYELSRTFTKWN